MRIFGLVSGFSGVFSLQPMLFRNFLLDLLPIFLFDLLSILLDLIPKYSFSPSLVFSLRSSSDFSRSFSALLLPSPFIASFSPAIFLRDFSAQIFLFLPHVEFFVTSLLFSLIIYCLSLNPGYNKSRRWI